jgi:hypothetical protein
MGHRRVVLVGGTSVAVLLDGFGAYSGALVER